ncbi:MAG: hypothetical protein HGA71_09085 [Azonexaceae bacterium]|nr:hypothetical protein [Azonexaceae bacterium]
MSMLALPETECQEILSLFRQHLPHVPDTWLQELAGNYGLDAVVDIDPNDVIASLSVPGKLCRIEIPIAEHETPDVVHRRMRNELAVRSIEPGQLAFSLLTIKDSSAKLKDIGELVRRVAGECMDIAGKGWVWYVPKPPSVIRTLTWIIASKDIQDSQ